MPQIKIGAGDLAPEAVAVMNACRDRGYGLAIATAGCNTQYSKDFLAEAAPELWTPQVLASPAYQACNPYKSYLLQPIISYFNLTGAARRARACITWRRACTKRAPPHAAAQVTRRARCCLTTRRATSCTRTSWARALSSSTRTPG